MREKSKICVARFVWESWRCLGTKGIAKREFALDGAAIIPGSPERRISGRRYTCGVAWYQPSGAKVRGLDQNPLLWSTKGRILWREIPGMKKRNPWILKFFMELENSNSDGLE